MNEFKPVLAGLAVLFCSYFLMYTTAGADFTWIYHSFHLLLGGDNPYKYVGSWGAGYLPYAPLFYPLTTVLAFAPLQLFDVRFASALQIALATTLIVYVAPHRRYLYVLLSFPFFNVIVSGQITPWVYLAALAPSFAPLAALKPSLVLVVLARHRMVKLWWVVPPVLLGLLSLYILPTWPVDWLTNVLSSRPQTYGFTDYDLSKWTLHIPILVRLFPWSLLLLLGLLLKDSRWLWLALLLMPTTPALYDLMLLFLLPKTIYGAIVLAVSTWIAVTGYLVSAHEFSLTFACFLAAMVVALVEAVVRYWRGCYGS